MSGISEAAVTAWMAAFARCVRERDLDGARALFLPEAAGFGTVAESYDHLDDLVARQWTDVWQRTTEFTFSDPLASWFDDALCAVATSWRSVSAEDGRTRTGRATLVLLHTANGLRCVHTHFSMTPGTAA